MKSILVSIFILIVVPTTLVAQDSLTLAAKGTAQNADITRLEDGLKSTNAVLSELARSIREIREFLNPSAPNNLTRSGDSGDEGLDQGLVPVGGVIAVSGSSCPEGWAPFTRGAGRFILSHGASYSIGQTGGAAEHKLTISEMPEHQHKIGVAYNALRGGGTDGENDYSGMSAHYPTESNPKPSFSAGGGKPHNNMPPFIVMMMCERVR